MAILTRQKNTGDVLVFRRQLPRIGNSEERNNHGTPRLERSLARGADDSSSIRNSQSITRTLFRRRVEAVIL